MYKIAILGCENSHANGFLNLIRDEEKYHDIKVVGVFSIYPEAAQKLSEEYGVPVMESYDSLVGQVDGIMVTARDGKYHYPYAKPYMAAGIPMFLDKPVTVTEEDARALAADLKANNVPVCGDSTLKYSPYLQDLKKVIADGEMGKCLGGYFRAPVSLVNEYGNFFFYSAHIVSMMTEVFGYYPKTVYAVKKENCVDCIVSYENFNVHLQYVDGNYTYYAMVSMEKGIVGDTLQASHEAEFARYYGILTGAQKSEDYADLTASVFIMNALNRSMETGEVVAVDTL